jgi:hypothetical protein
MYERVAARRHHRPRADLFHSALMLRLPSATFALEQAPVPDGHGELRGVVAEGPVGLRWAGRLRLFRYEVRCWRDGVIPDLGEAVDSPVTVSTEAATVEQVLEAVRSIPTPVWGRDEARVGDMWNSNSVVAWVLTRSGIDARSLAPPAHGRAPGWGAGCTLADVT